MRWYQLASWSLKLSSWHLFWETSTAVSLLCPPYARSTLRPFYLEVLGLNLLLFLLILLLLLLLLGYFPWLTWRMLLGRHHLRWTMLPGFLVRVHLSGQLSSTSLLPPALLKPRKSSCSSSSALYSVLGPPRALVQQFLMVSGLIAPQAESDKYMDPLIVTVFRNIRTLLSSSQNALKVALSNSGSFAVLALLRLKATSSSSSRNAHNFKIRKLLTEVPLTCLGLLLVGAFFF